jgi:hypothetical protein
MVRVTLIAAVCGCSAPATAPVTPATQPAPPATPAAQETLWDHGTFIEVDKAKVAPATQEAFEIWKSADGYRFVIHWKRPMPTGEPSEGAVTLVTDLDFRVTAGEMSSTLHLPSRNEVTTSRITRAPDGRLVTEIVAADGSKTGASSKTPNDWYIGGMITSFLTAMCQVDSRVTSPTVFPDKATTLEPLQQMPVPGTPRETMYRKLRYTGSGREVVAACEDGKLAGEVTRGVTIVRDGDLALAAVLESRFR